MALRRRALPKVLNAEFSYATTTPDELNVTSLETTRSNIDMLNRNAQRRTCSEEMREDILLKN